MPQSEHQNINEAMQTEFRSKLYQHLIELGRMQVEAEQMYHNRSSVITVALGMLAVAFVGLATKTGNIYAIGALITSIVGLLFSVLWFFLEQRNQVYFVARGSVIAEIEQDVIKSYQSIGLDFPAFWGRVSEDVKKIAKPYQRISAPLISRGIIPLVFCFFWLALTFLGANVLYTSANHTKNSIAMHNSLKNESNHPSKTTNKNITTPISRILANHSQNIFHMK